MNNKNVLLVIGAVSALIMYFIESKYTSGLWENTSGKKQPLGKENIIFGSLAGFFGFIPIFSALIACLFTFIGWGNLSNFSIISIILVVLSLLLSHSIYLHIKKGITDEDKRNELKRSYTEAKNIIKILYFTNSILLGVILGIYEIIQKSEPIGFFGVESMQIGKEILFAILPVVSYSAIDFFDIKNDIDGFVSELKKSFLSYYGFSVYLTLLIVGYVFFLHSEIYSYIFYGASVGAGIAVAISIIQYIKSSK